MVAQAAAPRFCHSVGPDRFGAGSCFNCQRPSKWLTKGSYLAFVAQSAHLRHAQWCTGMSVLPSEFVLQINGALLILYGFLCLKSQFDVCKLLEEFFFFFFLFSLYTFGWSNPFLFAISPCARLYLWWWRYCCFFFFIYLLFFFFCC